jgi:Sensors of blue-light using FAD
MAMIQLIYASRPFGFDAAVLNSILTMARHCNARDDITGALICREDLYLQMLEGPADMVEAAYARISRDGRHLEVHQLVKEPITERLFPQWAMRDDPAKSWMWTAKEVDRGAVEQASRDEVVAVFTRLAAEPADA